MVGAKLGAKARRARRGPRIAARVPRAARRLWDRSWEAGLTGLAAMVAYNLLLAIVPVALLAMFIAGQVLSSASIQRSVLTDLREVFPGAAENTLNALLAQIKSSTTGTGVAALLASVWLGSSFWGALDTAFARIYRCAGRPWLAQKRFAIGMLAVVLMLMVATVAVPVVQSLLEAGAEQLPFDLARVTNVVYAISLAISVLLLFGCLALIYARVPNRRVGWRAVWPGALGATAAIAAVSYAFPAYLSSISTIARFGTTIVFVLIVLGWFYLLALIILAGGVLNALRLSGGDQHALRLSGGDQPREDQAI